MPQTKNISTENRPKGSARNPSDTLDKASGDSRDQTLAPDDERPRGEPDRPRPSG